MDKKIEALKVAIVSLASLYPDDFEKVFGEKKLGKLLSETEHYAEAEIEVEQMLHDALYD